MQFVTNIIKSPQRRIRPAYKIALAIVFVAATLVMFFYNNKLQDALSPLAYQIVNFGALAAYLLGCFGLIRAQTPRPHLLGKLILDLSSLAIYQNNLTRIINLEEIKYFEFKYHGYQSFWFNPTGGQNYIHVILKNGQHHRLEIQIINRKDKETLRQLLSVLRLQYGCIHTAPLSPNASLFSNFDMV